MPVKRMVDHNIRCPHCNSDWMVKNGTKTVESKPFFVSSANTGAPRQLSVISIQKRRARKQF